MVVWVFKGKVEWVAWWHHKEWLWVKASAVRFDGTHVKMVYHKDGPSTHLFRPANADDDKLENHTGTWFYPALVSWGRFPNDYQDRLVKADFGEATIKLSDPRFFDELKRAKPSEIKDFEF